MQLTSLLTRIGDLAPTHQLLESGIPRSQIDLARARGHLLTVRRGWLATPAALRPAVIAVLHGARLTGATALRTYQVWAGEDRRVHIQTPPGGRIRQPAPESSIDRFRPMDHTDSTIVTHWAPYRKTSLHEAQWRVGVDDALVQHARSVEPEQTLASLTSAVTARRISRAQLDALSSRLPRRAQRAMTSLSLLDGSGLETIARLRMLATGLHPAQQALIGNDRVDFVIDGWLVIEVDGDQWHDPASDRARTNRLVRAGYRVLRFGYADIVHDWPLTAYTIERALIEPWTRPWGGR